MNKLLNSIFPKENGGKLYSRLNNRRNIYYLLITKEPIAEGGGRQERFVKDGGRKQAEGSGRIDMSKQNRRRKIYSLVVGPIGEGRNGDI
jgi:hypothetical protein